jgi:hypothetical protein
MGIISEDEWLVAGSESDESIARCDETYQLRERVGQLERLNASLAAQVDRMRPVVEAASQWARDDKGLLRVRLRTAIINYEAEMDKLMKENGSGIPTR